MRFSEKSFEVRFCAALSAALMPFNRNPQWFGLTQAQERRAGIDTMLRTGGRLLIFQFKACHKNGNLPSFKLEREQWEALTNFTRRHPRSTFYIFPEFHTTQEAANAICLLEKSWCVEAGQLGTFFHRNKKKTRTLTLDASSASVRTRRPYGNVQSQTVCTLFRCFCREKWTWTLWSYEDKKGYMRLFSSSPEISGEKRTNEPLFPLPDTLGGIAMGRPQKALDAPPIESVGDFEELLGEKAERDLKSGLFGLFLPDNGH